MPVPTGLFCARTHTNEPFSCHSCCKSFIVGRARRGNVYSLLRHGWAMFQKLETYNIMTFFFRCFWGKKFCGARGRNPNLGRPNVYHLGCVPETAVKPALLMGGRRGSSVHTEGVAAGTNHSIGGVLGNPDVEGRKCSFSVLKA